LLAREVAPAATLAEQAFTRLRADILSARLRPGEKMHVERLRNSYGLGATPLREALSRLSSLDLVVAEGQRGFRVAPVSIENLIDITKTRAWVEASALRTSIALGDRRWEAQVLAAAHRLKSCPKYEGQSLSDEWNRENREFHDALASASNSRQTMVFRAQLYDLSDRYRRLAVQNGLEGRDLDTEHQRIMDAALSRDSDAAVSLTVEHFIETSRAILSGELNDPAEVLRIVDALRKDIRAGTNLS